jgi:ABC-2 type transport system ATP-binding protein
MSIQITNLHKTYCLKNECKHVLKGVTLKVEAGEVFALMGQNGSGKTTLLKILATLVLPSDGKAAVCGYDTANSPSAVKHCVGLSVDSDTSFYQILTLQENLKFSGRLYNIKSSILNGKIKEYMEIFGISGFAQTKLNHCPSGVKQKFSILRAFLHEPKVLLIDEPSRSLDADSKLKIMSYIKESAKKNGKTCIFVTHDSKEADEFADRAGYLENGVILEK